MSRTRASACRAAGVGMRALVALVVSLVVGTVVLTGCQSNPKPPPLDSASESPSPSESPTAAAPTLPPEAKGTSEAAARAFVRHWIDVLNYVGGVGDASTLRRLSDPGCAACSAIADFIEQVHASGGAIEGRGWDVESLRVVPHQTGRPLVVDVQVNVHPQRVRTSSTSAEKEFKGGTRVKTFWLSPSRGSWTVTRLDQPE